MFVLLIVQFNVVGTLLTWVCVTETAFWFLTLTFYMAIASDQADRVLAWPLFRRLYVHMHTLNTRKAVHIRTSKPRRRLPIIAWCKFYRQKGNVASGFWFPDGHSLLQQTCGTCMQLSSYMESETTTVESSHNGPSEKRTTSLQGTNAMLRIEITIVPIHNNLREADAS